jgi:1-deoxy-D-xylulose-5-phosphate reductoisomerase
MTAKRVAVLGSTGSIGTQTLDVARRHPDKIQIVALAANRSVETVVEQAHEFRVRNVAFGDEAMRDHAMLANVREGVSVGFGQQGILDLVHSDDVDCVVNALVGAAGMRASYETLAAGKQLALANKESLVVAGDLIMPLAKQLDEAAGHPWALMPIDSEHGAIYQCLLGERREEVAALWVTASGGPFRGRTRDQLTGMTAKEALAHPTWKMGPKITIDSSTLMNKGLEVIEAHHLFDMPYDRIKVVVQPQSAIHSMVEYSDGSVKAHLGTTDMRIPIQFALSYPDRWDAPVEPMDFTKLGKLEFYPVDEETFRCFALAKRAGATGGTLPCVMNAANEVAVAAFLADRCGYLDIDACVEHAMGAHEVQAVESLDQLAEIDAWARAVSREYLGVA